MSRSRELLLSVLFPCLLAACAHSARIISVPAGATVLIDGKRQGTTPLLYNERSGTPGRQHTIRIELAGYPPLTEKEPVRICPTPANLILDAYVVGLPIGFCLRDEYVFDFVEASQEKASAMKPESHPARRK